MKNPFIVSSGNTDDAPISDGRQFNQPEIAGTASGRGRYDFNSRSEIFSVPGQTFSPIVIIEENAANKNLRWLGAVLALVSASLTLSTLLLLLF
jgi:hypothetical protein